MNSRKIILAKNPKLANSRNSRKFLPKISRNFPFAKVSSAKVSSFKVFKFEATLGAEIFSADLVPNDFLDQDYLLGNFSHHTFLALLPSC